MAKPREKTREELTAEIKDVKKKIRQYGEWGKDVAAKAVPRETPDNPLEQGYLEYREGRRP